MLLTEVSTICGDRYYHNPAGLAEYDGKERVGWVGVASGKPNGTAVRRQEGRDRTRPIKFSIVCRGKWDFGVGRNCYEVHVEIAEIA